MTRLSVLPTGARARVVLMAPELGDRADRLAGLGLAPGSEVALVQRRPAFVVEAGETRLAIDPEVARQIFVQRVA
ncbi:MAG TPA: FeoA family protein [Myxococcales bacterium]|nr:FeoA family protein [Myxococcales bacterium]